MLAVEGWPVVALEADAGRFNALEAILDVLDREEPAARQRVTALMQRFPKALDGNTIAEDAVVYICGAHTISDHEAIAFKQGLARFPLGVVDFPHMFTVSPDKEDSHRRAADFAREYGVKTSVAGDYDMPWVGRRRELFLFEHP
jgi:hypothetical protein